MRVIAIDPGYGRCGIAILEKNNNQVQVIFSECYETSANLNLNERLLLIGKEISSVIDEYTPLYLGIEGLFFAKNSRTAMDVSQVRGIIIYEAMKHGLSIHEFTPNQVKIAVTGYGSARKNDVYHMVGKLVKLNQQKKYLDDEIDAIAVGITLIASYQIAKL